MKDKGIKLSRLHVLRIGSALIFHPSSLDVHSSSRGRRRGIKKRNLPHTSTHMPLKEAFWATKREGIYSSLMPGAGGRDSNRRPAVYELSALPSAYVHMPLFCLSDAVSISKKLAPRPYWLYLWLHLWLHEMTSVKPSVRKASYSYTICRRPELYLRSMFSGTRFRT